VCTRLVGDLAERGLDASKGVLVVVDGGRALDKAIRAVFGANALVQRCRRHTERNGTDHLPEPERPLVGRRPRAAWQLGDADQARAELERLARSLARQRPGAAASLREGLELTLTSAAWASAGRCWETVASTSPVASMIEIVCDHATPGEALVVWGDGAAVGGGGDAGRRGPVPPLKGYRELPRLAAVLERATAAEPGLVDLAVGA
jgi:transposase-like protein